LTIGKTDVEQSGKIKEGELLTPDLKAKYPIRNFIPRFVADDAYNTSFGEQWNRYRKTQLDKFTGMTLSRDRFYAGTGWEPDELKGERVLEVGCGAGRFTQILLDAGAEVYAVDYSSAVDACWSNNGSNPRLNLFQADIYELPFPPEFFDKVFCYGVLQHTPDVKKSFMHLVPFLKPGGKLAIDCYRKAKWPSRWTSKYLWRPITKRMPHDVLFRIIEWFVPRWLPLDNWLQKNLPSVICRYVAGIVPCWNYTGIFPLTPELIVEWAILDTFDALSAWYDQPQEISVVESWFKAADLFDINVRRGGNGILGNGRKC